MPTSAEAPKQPTVRGITFPVLPPIPSKDFVEKIKAGDPERMAVRKRIMKHRSSKIQREQHRDLIASNAMAEYSQAQMKPLSPQAEEPQFPSSMYSNKLKQRDDYQFLKQCVEERPIAPIPQPWLDDIVARVPSRLKKREGADKLIKDLCDKISGDFHSAMMKHSVEFALRNPKEIKGNVSEKQATSVIPDHDRRANFLKNRKKILKNLHILHLAMNAVLDIGYTTFSSLLLVDLSGCRDFGPISCRNLKIRAEEECEMIEDHIMKTWFPKIIHLLTSKETLQSLKAEKQDSFFSCVSTLISIQGQHPSRTTTYEGCRVCSLQSPHLRRPLYEQNVK